MLQAYHPLAVLYQLLNKQVPVPVPVHRAEVQVTEPVPAVSLPVLPSSPVSK